MYLKHFLVGKSKFIIAICVSLFLTACAKDNAKISSTTENVSVNVTTEAAAPKYDPTQDESLKDYVEELNKLIDADPTNKDKWDRIIDYWKTVNSCEINYNVLPDGIKDDDRLCIVVLGFELNSDGSIKKELVDRLEVALNSLKKYPNAYIACTGGGTAFNNATATEADMMAKWLMEKGVDKDRIIIENKSLDTAQNAMFTYNILKENYPHINKLAVVTSDYHMPAGMLFFKALCILDSDRTELVSNAACNYPNSMFSVNYQVWGLLSIKHKINN